ncbi:MAG: glycosyltransferase family 92 protein [Verrucomicrobiae bacterium]|nr:glycosyltransferase family 92 protein [Verrucomicrobiae bacterium]
MNHPAAKTSRVRLRLGLRAIVGAWKQRQEPRLLERLKHPLAVCAIFREEAPFLDEWLTFHAGIGVTHFYLYNNFSTDNYREVLRPWQAAGYVTLTEWPVPVGQVTAYQDCVRRFKNEARWIAFFDVDEFLFSTQSQSIIPLLDAQAGRPGIEVWQVIFGANGHAQRPPAVLEAYTRSSPTKFLTVKTIANPRQIYKLQVHQFKYWRGRGLDTAGQVVDRSATPVYDQLRMNHYWSRSIEDLNLKVRRGDASTAAKRDLAAHLKYEAGMNDEPDFTILPIARAIRKPPAVAKAAGEIIAPAAGQVA